MFNFNREKFEGALKEADENQNVLLMNEVDQVKKFVEKALTMCLESTASISRATYPGVDL